MNNKADGKISIPNLIQFQLTLEDCFWTPRDVMTTRKTEPWLAERKAEWNSLKRYHVTYCRKLKNFPFLLYSWYVATVTLCQQYRLLLINGIIIYIESHDSDAIERASWVKWSLIKLQQGSINSSSCWSLDKPENTII